MSQPGQVEDTFIIGHQCKIPHCELKRHLSIWAFSSLQIAYCLTQKACIPSTSYRPSCPIFILSFGRYGLHPRPREHDRSHPSTSELRVSSGDRLGLGWVKRTRGCIRLNNVSGKACCDEDLVTPAPVYVVLVLPI